ncbi:MAG: hypothetical protein P0S96_01055 [Simkaniaceae bacterium]|nr:hypothetical protein [Candidatus Sacchlamyda saccharinae]
MDTDKKLILLAFCLLLLCIPKFIEERRLINQKEASELAEELAFSFFYPHSNSERIEMLQEHITRMENIQKRVSKSILAKHYIDYRDSISQKEENLRERKENSSEDSISFSTRQHHHIISYTTHTAEELLLFAAVVDEEFPEVLGTSIFTIENELIHVYPYEDFKTTNFQPFANLVLKKVFENRPTALQVTTQNTELYFQDQPSPITTDFLKENLALPDPTCYDYGFDWEYLGQTTNGCQLIRCNISEERDIYEEFHILKYDQDQWNVTDSISGCLSGEIKGDNLHFVQTVSEEYLLAKIIEVQPALESHYDQIPIKNIGTGKVGYTGTMEFAAPITQEGKFLKHDIIAFYPCEGWPPFSGQTFYKDDFFILGLEFLSELTQR